VLHGTTRHGDFLSEIMFGEAAFETRHLYRFESIYDTGSRVGAWRLLRVCSRSATVTLTVSRLSMALQRHPESQWA